MTTRGLFVAVAIGMVTLTTPTSSVSQGGMRPLPADLSGTYSAAGTGPNGTYTVTTEITKHGDVYEVRWTFPRGDGMVGIGFVDGDRFIVGYDGGTPGVSVYWATSARPLTLDGRYAGWGFATTYGERMVKGPPALQAAR